MASEQPCYTLINTSSDTEPPNEMQLKTDLEKGDVKAKTEALQKTIHMILNGEKLPGLLMTIIRFVLPLQDHTIKKLLLIFWEIVPKTTPDGKLMQEMILVCDAYRKDLQHPNEFLRGSTLRFLCKLKEPELLEPLMPAIRACLEHRHSYVRRNAVLAIFTIYKNFDFLIPDAPELIATFLEGEQDMSCKRNAFMMLIHADQDRALNYLSSCIDQVHTFGDILQLVIVELIYKVCHANPSERARFIRCIYNLLNSSSQAVRYEAAGTLVTLSTAPTAIKAAASCYIDLIVKESDNNVKLIVLDRLIALKEHPAHEKVLQELVMDILRVLSSPDHEVRRKTLQLALELVTPRTIEEMVLVLKKEVSKTHNTVEHEASGKYRQLLVRTLHSCCIKFPEVSATVIPLLMDFLSDTNELAAADVLVFIREAIQKFEQLQPLIIEIPLVENELKRIAGEKTDTEDLQSSGSVKKLVTADGTYATQSAFSTSSSSKKVEKRPSLLQHLLDGDFFFGASLATTLVKLAFTYIDLEDDTKKQNKFCAEAMLIMASIIHLGKSGLPQKAMTNDDMDRISLCLEVIAERPKFLRQIFLEESRKALAQMLVAQGSKNLPLVTKVTQLTGFSDPVYVEAYVHVNQYDIVLDILVVNQTNDTLQNCCVELATLGDLKLVEKPSPVVLAPHDFCNIKANVKVSSTENGIIFGNIVYDLHSSMSDRNVVVLNDIHIDIMDYIVPASCTDTEFRQMWVEFEWENKVGVSTNITDLRAYLDHLVKSTNMKCLTPEKALSGDCGFMAANLYARSIFGEDTLANVSIERDLSKPNAPVTGHIRIRAKSQGMALSMGDKVNQSQKRGARPGVPKSKSVGVGL
ncbi:unnamed protein product [Darwinula stevensoni]|uniref:Coatomer subunit beta n=1 Tax=Darwinula stevensoni TaxID=69355 RepID=A0A7R8XCI8_9CRUS|nr:unnamed protein product [Darwinula stevensoni]CAG0887605.1 unnamed protein product [Darwinula stevensoni]